MLIIDLIMTPNWGSTERSKTPSGVIEAFKQSPPHNKVMLNAEMWSKKFDGSGEELNWGSVGAAHLEVGGFHFAPLWFAAEADNSTC